MDYLRKRRIFMKNTLRFIATVITLSLMFTVFATSIFVASTSVSKYVSDNWRGNGSTTGRGSDNESMAIGRGEKVTFSTKLTLTLDPKTDAHKVTSTAALRQYHWYGYSTLISQTVFDDFSMSNADKTSSCTYSSSVSSRETTTATGDYYVAANTSGASSAFYNNYNFTITYTVGN